MLFIDQIALPLFMGGRVGDRGIAVKIEIPTPKRKGAGG